MATTKSQTLRFDGKSLTLPSEILIQIAEYVACLPSSQKDLWAMTRVSRSWYAAAVPALYHSPNITGRNFQLFVRTLCPSINPHLRKTDFSAMIKVLDMSKLVHDGSKSLTSRILGRVRDGLEVFVAPQSSFACERLSDWLCDLPKLRLFRVTLRNQQSLGTIMINYQTIFGGQNPHPLEYLMFDCTDVNGYWTDADYEELWSAVAEGYLGRLRRVEFHYRKNARPPKFVKKQLEELNDLLQALAREDREREIINVEDAGAYIGKG
ncbi:MAG: hypothetical protein Q9201_005192 [Fulgogasparrea decipioides]